MNRQSPEDCLGSKAILYDTVMEDKRHSLHICPNHRLYNNKDEP